MTFKNDNWTYVLTMLENIVQISWAEDQRDSIRTNYCSIGNLFLRNPKIIENFKILALINQS